MSFKRILILCIASIVLFSCTGLEHSMNEGYQHDDHHNNADKVFHTVEGIIGILDLLSSNSDEETYVAPKKEYTFNPEIHEVPENNILIEYIQLKPTKSAFYSKYHNLLAEKVITGRINLYETYDRYGEHYYLIQKGEEGELQQVRTHFKNFRFLIQDLMKDNIFAIEEMYSKKISYPDLLYITGFYNSYYEEESKTQ